MAVSSPDRWGEFDHVELDPTEILGTPGLPEPVAFADAISSGFKAEWRQVSPSPEAQFLVGGPVRLAQGPATNKLSSLLSLIEESVPEAHLGAESCSVLQETESASGVHLSAQQLVRGEEVLGARFKVHLNGDEAYAITGRPVGNIDAIDPGDRPPVSEVEVAAAVRHHFDLPQEVEVKVIRPIVVPIGGRGHWALETGFLLDEPPSDVRAFILSEDLSKLVLSFNIASAYFHGEAEIYAINPLRTPTPHVDRLDYIGPTPPDGLSGPVAEVRPHHGQAIADPSRDFRGAVEPGLDEVQTYYHLCAGVRYFRTLFGDRVFQKPPFGPIRATVRDGRAQNNAYFLPDTGELQFGDFGNRPTARSADVILHELGHAVTDSISRLARGPRHTQSRGLSEGYSDYFAASALDSPIIGDYVTNGRAGTRDCSRPGLQFLRGFAGKEHATGEVWASILWSIRENCGRGIADTLAAESLQFLDASSAFEDGRTALLTADKEIFPGAGGMGRHADVINAGFDARLP